MIIEHRTAIRCEGRGAVLDYEHGKGGGDWLLAEATRYREACREVASVVRALKKRLKGGKDHG